MASTWKIVEGVFAAQSQHLIRQAPLQAAPTASWTGLETLEPRTLLSAFSNAAFNGTFALHGAHDAGTVVLDGAGKVTSASLTHEDGTKLTLTGTYSVSASGAVTVSLSDGHGHTYSGVGAATSTKDLVATTYATVPNSTTEDMGLNILVKHSLGNFSNASMSGTWDFCNEDTHGSVTLDGNGHITGGSLVRGNASVSLTSGTYSVAPDGTVTASPKTNGPADEQPSPMTGTLNNSKDVAVFNDTNLGHQVGYNSTWDADLSLMVKRSGTYNNAGAAGTWTMEGMHAHGTFTFNGSGGVTGSILDCSNTAKTLAGTYSVNANGNASISATLTETAHPTNKETFAGTGVINGSRNFVGPIHGTNSNPQENDPDITVLINSGDTVAPKVTVSSLATKNTKPTLTGTVTDASPSSGISKVTVAVGGQTLTATVSGTTWSVAVPTALAQGVYNVQATATDKAGNSASDTTTNELTIDTAAPKVTVTPQIAKTTKPTITGTVTDASPSSGISKVTVVVGGQTLTATVSGTTWSVAVPTALANGTYNVTATATDKAGNSGSDTTSNELTVNMATGTFGMVGFCADNTSEFSSQIGNITLDGTGKGTGSITAESDAPFGDDAGGGVGPISATGCSLDATGRIMTGGASEGYIAADSSMFALAVDQQDSHQETAITAIVRQSSGMSAAMLNGQYNFVSWESNHGTVFTSGIGSVTFNGMGSMTKSVTQISQGQTSGQVFGVGSSSASYALTSAGKFTSGPSTGYVGPGAAFMAWAPVPGNTQAEEVGISLAVKQGSGFTLSSLKGRYYMLADIRQRQTATAISSGIGYVDFNGTGGYTGAWTNVANGQSSAGPLAVGSMSGTYTVSAVGKISMKGEMTGFLSADSSIGIWTAVPGAAGKLQTGIGLLIKAPTATQVSASTMLNAKAAADTAPSAATAALSVPVSGNAATNANMASLLSANGYARFAPNASLGGTVAGGRTVIAGDPTGEIIGDTFDGLSIGSDPSLGVNTTDILPSLT